MPLFLKDASYIRTKNCINLWVERYIFRKQFGISLTKENERLTRMVYELTNNVFLARNMEGPSLLMSFHSTKMYYAGSLAIKVIVLIICEVL